MRTKKKYTFTLTSDIADRLRQYSYDNYMSMSQALTQCILKLETDNPVQSSARDRRSRLSEYQNSIIRIRAEQQPWDEPCKSGPGPDKGGGLDG